MTKFLLSILLFTNLYGEPYSSFEGTYEHPETFKKITLNRTLTGLTGIYVINYVNEFGDDTGKTLTYYFYFNTFINKKTLEGTLTTFDSHYNCKLENGNARIEILNNKEIKISFNQALFSVQKTYQKKNTYQTRETKYNRTPSKIECRVTSLLETAVVLNKI